MADEIIYPVPKYHFEVSWGDATIICSEINGLNSTLDVINYTDGKTSYTTAQPGIQKFDDIVFTKAVFESDEALKEWHDKVVQREDEYRDVVSVVLKNDIAETVMTWSLQNAWADKWEQPDLNSSASEVSIEKLTVACENIVVEFGS